MIASNFWGVYAASMQGSAGGATITKRNGTPQLQKRRARVIPQGNAPHHWRQVYGLVENLWNNMSQADKDTWLYQKKPPGFTARDYFGHWNNNLVGRWCRWVRRRPSRLTTGPRKTDWPGAEPLPAGMCECMPGSWRGVEGLPPVMWTKSRSAQFTAGTVAAAWAGAWAALLAKPWEASYVMQAKNYGFVGNYAGQYRAYAFQAYCELDVGGLDCYTWRAPRLHIMNGAPLGGAYDLPWRFGKQDFGDGTYNYDWPDIRALDLNDHHYPMFWDIGGWAPPAPPSGVYVYRGWYIGLCSLSYWVRD